MGRRPFLMLLAGFALALMAAGEADAIEPVWSYTTGDGGGVGSVSISADGEHIVAAVSLDCVVTCPALHLLILVAPTQRIVAAPPTDRVPLLRPSRWVRV